MSALTAWVQRRRDPAGKRRPRIADGTLVPPDQVRFPPIPANPYGGVERPAASTCALHDTLHVLDFGPLYRAGRFRAASSRASRRSSGPQATACSSRRSMPTATTSAASGSVFSQVPIGTYTGWNLGRKDRFERRHVQSAGELHSRSPRPAPSGWPRATRDSRSRSAIRRRRVYLAAFKKAADGLVAKRYLLPEDAKLLVERAGKEGIRTGP